MSHPWRILLVSTGLGLASAFVLIGVAFVVSMYSREVAQWVSVPGELLVGASNRICPPSGAECFLGSSRQGARHLWLLICVLASWSFIFFVAWWSGLRLAVRARARGRADRRPLFANQRQGTS